MGAFLLTSTCRQTTQPNGYFCIIILIIYKLLLLFNLFKKKKKKYIYIYIIEDSIHLYTFYLLKRHIYLNTVFDRILKVLSKIIF